MLSPDCCAAATTTAFGLAFGRTASASATKGGVVFAMGGTAGGEPGGGCASAIGAGTACGALDAGAVCAGSEAAADCRGGDGLAVAAGFGCLSSFAERLASDAGVGTGDPDASTFGGATLGGISAAEPFEGFVSGNEIFGVVSGACFNAAPSSAGLALAPSSPIS